jgi:hypothetical protein
LTDILDDAANVRRTFRAAELCFHLGLYEEASACYYYVWKRYSSRNGVTILTLYSIAGYAQAAVAESQRVAAQRALLNELPAAIEMVGLEQQKHLVQSLFSAIRKAYLPSSQPLEDYYALIEQGFILPSVMLLSLQSSLKWDELSRSFFLYHLTFKEFQSTVRDQESEGAGLPEPQFCFLHRAPGPFAFVSTSGSTIIHNTALQKILQWSYRQLQGREYSKTYELLMDRFSEEYYQALEYLTWLQDYQSELMANGRKVWGMVGLAEAALFLFLWERSQTQRPPPVQFWDLSIEATLKTICSLILEGLEAFGELKIDRAVDIAFDLLHLPLTDLGRKLLGAFTSSDHNPPPTSIGFSSTERTRRVALDLISAHLGADVTYEMSLEPEQPLAKPPESDAPAVTMRDQKNTQALARVSLNPTLAWSLRSSDWSYKLFKQYAKSRQTSFDFDLQRRELKTVFDRPAIRPDGLDEAFISAAIGTGVTGVASKHMSITSGQG